MFTMDFFAEHHATCKEQGRADTPSLLRHPKTTFFPVEQAVIKGAAFQIYEDSPKVQGIIKVSMP